jgi:ribonuclease BN (tRNA processing enzyme)
MELTVIGAGPSYTDRRGSLGASYLVRVEGAALLLDIGQGSFPNLASTIEPSTLTAVLVTHLHADHFVDLVPLRHYLRFEFEPSRPVRVLGPRDLGARLDGLDGQPGFGDGAFHYAHLAECIWLVGPFEVSVKRVTHSDESYGVRVAVAGDRAPGLVYSGDCGQADDLLPLIRPGDTLLSEASFGAGPVPDEVPHLTSQEAARAAKEGGAARLLLTHIQTGYPRADALAAAEAVFDGPIQFVTEGDVFEI